jgi:hypothetical protein
MNSGDVLMMRCRFVVPTVWAACTALGLVPSRVTADVPPRCPCGQTLEVPKEQQTLGEVYYVLPGAGTQLTWQTDAPLLRLVATCNRIVGYLVAPFEVEEGRPPLLGGALRLPVASFTTGYEQFDTGWHGPGGLNRAEHPEILVSLVSAGPAKEVVKDNNQEQCAFTLVGELTIRNKTIRFESPARMALLPFANATQVFSPSDLLMVRTKFTVPLADAGVDTAASLGPGFAGKTAEVEIYLMGTTIHPNNHFDPRVNQEAYVKQLQFLTRLRDFNDPVDAYAYGRTYLKEIWDDSRMLNDLASAVLTDEQIKRRDLPFVEQAAQRANELTGHEDPQYLTTLARLCYERGDLEGAIKWSRKAVDHLEGQPFFVGPPIRAALQAYEAEAQTRPKMEKPKGETE